MLLQGFTPVTTGEPVSTVVLTVIAAIASLFRLFGGGVSGAVKTALEGIRGTIATVADNLTRYAWSITRALGKVLTALHTVWTRVVWPILRQLPRALGRLRRLIERDLPRLLHYIERIRQKVLEIYERWARPVLVTIQRLRRMILILRLLHIHWGDKLDRRLAELQGWVMKPITVALEHIAMLEQWINVIVSADQLIQETIFGWSAYHYQDPIVRTTLGAFARPMNALEKLELWPRGAAVPAGKSTADLALYLRQNTGPMVQDMTHANAAARRQLGLGG